MDEPHAYDATNDLPRDFLEAGIKASNCIQCKRPCTNFDNVTAVLGGDGVIFWFHHFGICHFRYTPEEAARNKETRRVVKRVNHRKRRLGWSDAELNEPKKHRGRF